jgi:hypothetical protein
MFFQNGNSPEKNDLRMLNNFGSGRHDVSKEVVSNQKW